MDPGEMLRRNCRVYIALDGVLVRRGRRLRGVYSSAQPRSVMAAGMRRRTVILRREARAKRSHQDQGRTVFQRRAARGGPHDPQGAGR